MHNTENQEPVCPECADSSHCFRCGALLGRDDAGATKRFISRESKQFLCMNCLCQELGCSEAHLRGRIEFLRKNGCLLFPSSES